MDELGKVFDGIDVVVGRRADKRDAWLRMPQFCYVLIHFGAGKLAAFAGLGSLGDLNLQFESCRKISRGNAKTP